MAEIISKREWLKIKPEDILGRLQGNIDYGNGRKVENSPVAMKFWADNASFPYKSHDTWFMTEDIRWGYIPADTDVKALVDKVNREDIWREAAKAVGVPDAQIPSTSSRGVETFFDGVKFDPEDPASYLKSLKIKKA
jgi:nitrate/nitrite transport system substrate-binding protein